MSIPKEPRQIMINLMYLVLTALLALNVSNEILNAFKTLSLSIDRSNVSIDNKTIEVYSAIKENEKAPGQEAKVRPYREKADQVVKESDDMVKFLNNWKRRLCLEAVVIVKKIVAYQTGWIILMQLHHCLLKNMVEIPLRKGS